MGRRRIQSRRAPWRAAATATAVVVAAVLAVVLTVVGHSPADPRLLSPATATVSTGGGTAATSPAAGSSPSGHATTASPSRPGPRPSATPAAAQGGATSGATAVATPGHRVVTFVNKVGQTIWVAAGQQTPQPALRTTGWVLAPGRSLSISVPDHWNGRFWGRTGCSFDAAGRGHCESGDCGGRFQCPGYGSIPATLAEFNLNSFDGLDFYDVSMVDGSNLPMWINTVGGASKDRISPNGCEAAGCTTPVVCPAALQIHAGGHLAGCESPCGVFGTDQYCCRGQWASRAACDPTTWPIDYAQVFKRAEPFAYSYCDDDATSTFTSTGEAGYRITFGLTAPSG